jgi:type VI secretion system protein VasD
MPAMEKQSWNRWVWLVAIAAMLTGCASTERDLNVPYVVTLEVSADANPGMNQKPAPILVGIYELKSTAVFDVADFQALQDRPKETLGEDLVFVQQMVLQPGEKKVIKRPGSSVATGLGIVAGYRTLDGTTWKQTVPLAGVKHTNLYKVWQFSPSEKSMQVDIRKNGIEIETPKS